VAGQVMAGRDSTMVMPSGAERDGNDTRCGSQRRYRYKQRSVA